MASAAGRQDRYTSGAVAFHWTIAALILVNLFIGLFHDSLPQSLPLIPVHKSIGLTVLVLTLGRIAWRIGHKPPPLPDYVPGWQARLAQVVHLALYALMLLMPLSGWIMVSNGKTLRPLTWFGLFDVPYLRLGGPAVGGPANVSHAVLGYTMTALVVLHIAGALKHQFVDRDAMLARMAPWLRRPAR